jgi:hypothetical protein
LFGGKVRFIGEGPDCRRLTAEVAESAECHQALSAVTTVGGRMRFTGEGPDCRRLTAEVAESAECHQAFSALSAVGRRA